MGVMNNPETIAPFVFQLFELLPLSTIKDLSLLSKSWFDFTNSTISKNCVFISDEFREKEMSRLYKNFEIISCNDENFQKFTKNLFQITSQTETPVKRLIINNLKIINCKIDQQFFEIFSKINVEKVVFENCKFSDFIESEILCMNIRTITFKKDSYSNQDLKNIKNIIKQNSNSLQNIEIKDTHSNYVKIGQEFLDSMNIPNLIELKLNIKDLNCSSESIETFLKSHTNLESLTLKNMNLDLSFLRHCKNLKSLSIMEGQSYLNDNSAFNFDNIEHLGMDFTNIILDISKSKLLQNLKSFKSSLYGDFSEDILLNILSKMPNLVKLNLSFISDGCFSDVFSIISKKCLNLKDLSLWIFPDTAVEYSLPIYNDPIVFPNLETLSLVTLDEVDLGKVQFPMLKKLSIRSEDNSKFVEIIKSWIFNCKNIEDLSLNHNKITFEADFFQFIVESFPFLKSLSLGEHHGNIIDIPGIDLLFEYKSHYLKTVTLYVEVRNGNNEKLIEFASRHRNFHVINKKGEKKPFKITNGYRTINLYYILDNNKSGS
ncbi:hypothetical protein ACFFRR_002004 [Megaselia abdita]